MGDQRPQAFHHQRLRCKTLRGVRHHDTRRGHYQGHLQLSGAARHTGPHGHALQRNAGRALLNEAIRSVNAKGHDAEGLCNMAKLFASEEIFKVCMHAVEPHGGNGIMLDFGVEKFMRDASLFLHRDATVDISKFRIVKSVFPHTAGKYAGPEN